MVVVRAGNKPEPSVTGIKNIRTKISGLNLQDVNVDLESGSVDAQESKDGEQEWWWWWWW